VKGGPARRSQPRRHVIAVRLAAALWAPGFASTAGCVGDRIELGSDPDGGTNAVVTFAPPELVTELGAAGADDDKPTLTADRLEIYFLSTRDGGPGGGDVWRSTRSNTGAVWDSPSLVSEVSTTSHEKSPAVSEDGLTLWVASDRSGGQGGLDIWVSTRTDRSSAWSTPAPVAALNSAGDEIPRPPGQGGLVMPIGVRPPSSSEYQIELSSRSAPTAAWMAPTLLTEVDTANTDVDGFLSDDGLVLHFSSDRLNKGDQDLFVGQRVATGAAFTGFVALSELNSSHDDRDPWLSADTGEIFFSSDRGGNLKIYHSTRVAQSP
jgi:hypothetical protein